MERNIPHRNKASDRMSARFLMFIYSFSEIKRTKDPIKITWHSQKIKSYLKRQFKIQGHKYFDRKTRHQHWFFLMFVNSFQRINFIILD